jgi:6-phosphogluconolactonase
MSSPGASLVAASSKNEVASILNKAIAKICVEAINARGTFTVALSGGSLPSLLADLDKACNGADADPMYSCWHIVLADERCVPSDDPENNLKAIKENFLSKVPIPEANIHGIDETKLDETTEAVASAYELVLKKVMESSGGLLDLAVLGFGPDGKSVEAELLCVGAFNNTNMH